MSVALRINIMWDLGPYVPVKSVQVLLVRSCVRTDVDGGSPAVVEGMF